MPHKNGRASIQVLGDELVTGIVEEASVRMLVHISEFHGSKSNTVKSIKKTLAKALVEEEQ